MKRLLSISVLTCSFIFFLLYAIPTLPVYALELPESTWSDLSFYGKLNLFTSYAAVSGNTSNFLSENGISPEFGLNYTVELGIEGALDSFDLKSSLIYSSNAKPDFTLNLENQDWHIQYQPFTLRIPTLKSIFSTQNLTGLSIARKDQTFYLFYGTKLYETRNWSFTVKDEKKLSYTLFESTKGDVVENSEMVFLQGTLLKRYEEYKFNYLSGEIKFLIPLRAGSKLEIKYNYLPTGKKVKDSLTGIYYQYNLNHSYFGFFYFDETNKDRETIILPTSLATSTSDQISSSLGSNDELGQKASDEDEITWNDENAIHSKKGDKEDEDVEEDPTDDIRNRYLGTTINASHGPFSLTGEMACLLPECDGSKQVNEYGGNLDFQYATRRASVEYQLTTATDHFTGIGVTSVLPGEKQELAVNYQIADKWKADLALAQVKKNEQMSSIVSRIATTNLWYQWDKKQRFSLSFDANSLKEWGQTSTLLDYQLGWEYLITPKTSLSVKNSLRRFEKNQILFKITDKTLNLRSEYKQYPEIVPFLGENWVREFNTDLSWRPYNGINFIGDVDYWQPFDATFAGSRRRMALTTLLVPNQKINARGNYVYYFNPTNNCRTLFFDLNSTVLLPYDMQVDGGVERILIDSETVKNIDANWQANLKFPVTKNLLLSYQHEVIDRSTLLKYSGTINTANSSTSGLLSARYAFDQRWTATPSAGFLNSSSTAGSSTTNTEQKTFGFKVEYSKDTNVFKYDMTYQHVEAEEQLSQTISLEQLRWNTQFSYSSEMTYLFRRHRLSMNRHSLDIKWLDKTTPVRPAMQLFYQKKDTVSDLWEKYKASLRLTYAYKANTEIFIEGGFSGTNDSISPENTYHGKFVKIGTEISF